MPPPDLRRHGGRLLDQPPFSVHWQKGEIADAAIRVGYQRAEKLLVARQPLPDGGGVVEFGAVLGAADEDVRRVSEVQREIDVCGGALDGNQGAFVDSLE